MSSSSTSMMNLSSSDEGGIGKKRPRDNEDDPKAEVEPDINKDDHDRTATIIAAKNGNQNKDGAPPPYGSQAYWDHRYKSQFESLLQKQQQQQQQQQQQNSSDHYHHHEEETVESRNSKEGTDEAEGEKKGNDTTLPYHAWYFTYHELRPLLLPIVLGGGKAKTHIVMEDKEEEDNNSNANSTGGKEAEKHGERVISNDSKSSKGNNANEDEKENIPHEYEEEIEDEENHEKESDDDEDIDEEVVEVVEDGDDNDDDASDAAAEEREGLASKGPIRVLEIGCGDVPLGAALGADLLELQDITGEAVVNVVQQIVCSDYSNVVIEMMKKQYRTGEIHNIPENKNPALQQVHLRDVPLEFATVDARKIPFEKESFELILEKGTLDAMLSDNKNGTQDCIEIVSECARVLKENGCLIIVSHLNAHTPSGLMWLDKVVSSGLKKASDNYSLWKIEVHGNSAIVDDDSDGRVPKGSAGPAVYVCWKNRQDEEQYPASEPRILLKMFDYST